MRPGSVPFHNISLTLFLVGGMGLFLGLIGQYYAVFDGLNSAAEFFLILMLLSVISYSLLRWRDARYSILLAVVFLLCLAFQQIPYLYWPSTSHSSRGDTFRVVSFNILKDGRDPEGVANWIRAQKPDAVVLLEAAGRSASVPDRLADILPYRQYCDRRQRCSTILLARKKPDVARPLAHGDADNRRALSAAVMAWRRNGGWITLIGVHLSRPYPAGRQRAEVEALKAQMQKLPDKEHLILAGDFNATRRTYAVRNLAQALVEARGAGRTWPVPDMGWGPIGPLLDIDHIFSGKGLEAIRVSRGPALGSDHCPIVATFVAR